MRKKILFDISHGIHGNTGIQQDMRRILHMLSEIDDLEIDILIYDMIDNNAYTDFDINNHVKKYGLLVAQAQLAHHFFNPGNHSEFQSRFLGRIRKHLHYRNIRKKSQMDLLSLDKKYNEAFYRKLLQDSYEDSFLEKFKNYQIKLSTYSTEGSILGMMNDSYEIPTINTSEYDYAFFFQELPIKVSSNTKKIVRSFDLIQIFGPDVVFKADYKSNYQYKSINECINQNVTFLTISDVVKNEIHTTFSKKANIITVPVAVSSIFQQSRANFELINFIKNHDDDKDSQYAKIKGRKNLQYFLSVSTIEPRKNIISTYKAFKKLKQFERKENLILLLVGKVGWNLSNEYRHMFKDTDVIVLSNVSTEEIPMLYSNAQALVYVPFQEGFGLPPAEAMLCRCPVILSDIPVHHEIHENNALYVNHYDVDDIFKKMFIAREKRGSKSNEQMLTNAFHFAEKYKTDRLGQVWRDIILE